MQLLLRGCGAAASATHVDGLQQPKPQILACELPSLSHKQLTPESSFIEFIHACVAQVQQPSISSLYT